MKDSYWVARTLKGEPYTTLVLNGDHSGLMFDANGRESYFTWNVEELKGAYIFQCDLSVATKTARKSAV